jgi:hypothetical protein
MDKRTNRIPPALKHGIYSGIGPLPTEDPAEFKKFKQEIFDEYRPAGRPEKSTVEYMACLMWRRDNLSTYHLANRARSRRAGIYAKLVPPASSGWPMLQSFLPDEPESRSPEELAALHKSADRQVQRELGAAIELVEGDIATIEYLEKELAILDRLNGMIARAFKSLLYVRGIKSMSISAPPAPSEPTLVPQQIDCST